MALERDLVVVLERAELDRLHVREAEQEEHRVLQPLVDDDVVVDDLGDARLTGVEQVDRGVDGVLRVGEGHHRIEVVAPLPERGDGLGQVVHGGRSPYAVRRSQASASWSSVTVSASRAWSAPATP